MKRKRSLGITKIELLIIGATVSILFLTIFILFNPTKQISQTLNSLHVSNLFSQAGITPLPTLATPTITANKVTICHSDGGNKYQQLSVTKDSGVDGHNNHSADIIPPFTYSCTYGTCQYNGKNWTDANRVTYANNCVVVVPTPTPPHPHDCYGVYVEGRDGSWCCDSDGPNNFYVSGSCRDHTKHNFGQGEDYYKTGVPNNGYVDHTVYDTCYPADGIHKAEISDWICAKPIDSNIVDSTGCDSRSFISCEGLNPSSACYQPNATTGAMCTNRDKDPDKTPPIVAISSPKDNARLVPGSEITIIGHASDNDFFRQEDFYVDNQLICTDYIFLGGYGFAREIPCKWQVPSTYDHQTKHTIKLNVADVAGNVGTAEVSVK